jgi:hypothetical protein
MSIPSFKSSTPEAFPTLDLGQPDRQLTPKEALDTWTRVFGDGVLAPHQLKGYRTVVGWRVTRAIGFQSGRLHLDQRLSELDATEWTQPKSNVTPTIRNKGITDMTVWGTRDLLARNGGLALLPQPQTAAQHALAVMRLAESMWLQRGSKQFPYLGHYGLDGLTHEATIMDCWPSRPEILAFEDKVIDQIQGLVMKWSRRRIQAHLRDLFDLSPKEIGGLVALATEEARIEASQDIETSRAVMVGRVEDYIDRMRESADSTNEMKGIKVLCAIHGLHKTNPEDTAEALIGVIAKVASDHSTPIKSPLRIEIPSESEPEAEI